MFFKQLGWVTVSLLILGSLSIGGGVLASQGVKPTIPERVPPTISPPPPVEAKPAPPVSVPDHRLVRNTQKESKEKSDDTPELSYDDGEMKGKRSIAGGGHAVKFEAPGDAWTLTAVRIHGARYGYPRAPREYFAVFLCDEQFHKIEEFLFPYAKFERGDSKWVTLAVKPTRVPKTFILGVDFDPTGTKGVYVSFDKAGSGRSMIGLPGQKPQLFPQGDWLIRAKLEPAKEPRLSQLNVDPLTLGVAPVRMMTMSSLMAAISRGSTANGPGPPPT